MPDMQVDFSFSVEVLQDASDAEAEVAKLLDEVKNEIENGGGRTEGLTMSGASLKNP